MTQPLQRRRYTIEEYLERESAAPVRSEYHAGDVYEMSGGTLEHITITGNLIRRLLERFEGKPCRAFDSSMRVATRAAQQVFYPDATIACPPIEYLPSDRGRGTILNPTVIFEVLSRSTRGYDLGEKAESYESIPSIRHMVFIEQEWPRVVAHARRPDGWHRSVVASLDESLVLVDPDLTLPLSEIYRDIAFRPRAEIDAEMELLDGIKRR